VLKEMNGKMFGEKAIKKQDAFERLQYVDEARQK